MHSNKQTNKAIQSIIITKLQYTENKEKIPNASGEEETQNKLQPNIRTQDNTGLTKKQ